ncbi:movement protein [Currant virus A]|uniref:Movement protein n=1 Tax=Currant virus A TaxID=1770618 RepID=A0A126JJD6_9VIRU|nr:movement protein [Currant virus A]ALT08068.1 movement protein [Currant virus A]
MSIIQVKKFLKQVNGDEGRIFIDSIHAKDIYSDANAFNRKTLSAVKRFQSSIAVPANCTGMSNVIQFNMFDEAELAAIKESSKKFSLLHIGAVLISVTCLFKLKKPLQGKIIYFDPRFVDKNDACQAGFSFSMQSGSAFFLYRPNYPISTSDPNILQAARVKFEFDAINVIDNSHLFFIDFGVMYQLSNQAATESITAADAALQFQSIFGSSSLPRPEDFLEDSDITDPPSITLIDVSVDQSFRKGGLLKGPARATRARRYHARSNRQGSEFIGRPIFDRSNSNRGFNLVRSSSFRPEFIQGDSTGRKSIDSTFQSQLQGNKGEFFQRGGDEHHRATSERDKKGAWKLHLGTFDRPKQQLEFDRESRDSSVRRSSSPTSSQTIRGGSSDENCPEGFLSEDLIRESRRDRSERDDNLPEYPNDYRTTRDSRSPKSSATSANKHVISKLCSNCEGLGCSRCGW